MNLRQRWAIAAQGYWARAYVAMNERQWRAMRTCVFFARQAEGHAASKKLPKLAPNEEIFLVGVRVGEKAATLARQEVINAMDSQPQKGAGVGSVMSAAGAW
jgi:hypothetical protein